MLKTVIMDFDGLIIDTEVVWYQIYKEWFTVNKDYSLSPKEFLSCVGSSAEQLFKEMDGKGIHVNREAFQKETRDEFLEKSSKLEAKEGVEDFLKNAHDSGLTVVMATSSMKKKPTVNLERLKLLQYFDFMVTAEDVARIKPYPDLFLTAARKSGAAPSECLVVEDSLNGLIAGENAGMRVLIVPNDITKYSDFQNAYKKYGSLKDVNISEISADFAQGGENDD